MGLKENLCNSWLVFRFDVLQDMGWSVVGAWDSNNEIFRGSGDSEKRGNLIEQAINKVKTVNSKVDSVRVVLSDGRDYKTLVIRGKTNG